MAAKVALIGCDSYREEPVYQAVKKGVHLLGGLSCFANPGETIVLKPNILVGDIPEKASTTHPAVFTAVAKIFKESGAKILYGDSPAVGTMERTAKTGLNAAAEELGIQQADFRTPVKVSFNNALLAKQLALAKGALDADGIISIPKMKTHGFTRITGAVKNQFGCLPGLQKAEFHVKMPDIYDFSKVLVDINNYLKPRLYIMDGIIAMEGNGPRSGDPVAMNVLLLSSDPVALDAVFCRLIHMNPECVPTMAFGKESGLGTYLADEIDIIGDSIHNYANKNFCAVRKPPYRFVSSWYFPNFLKNYISPKPIIDKNRCSLCGQCCQQCPVKPAALLNDKNNEKIPVFNYNRCIRCYCCQEICPQKAISIKTPILGKLIH
ncbi:MAG: DUF362 domain-containing protein [bacterium]|nr:DUF362 domain-containing protein [bacterium]